ncbi:class I SAM-dependent methyltransferase [Desertihabitans brevis]|uniref:Class I SAM-dependent methyltransferase n=1 Tax=Desertihabitans brevis TaxID=2268447 RepID=A0A367YTX1_9ACTN|nr:class I SAM-dependent methyltransferase [Desertihabitans brevis]RCK69240.1 class I SAM-dependent methyltransferase [Desertihabitans brevis]
MATARRTLHPVAALEWMVPSGRDVLDLAAGSPAFARELARTGFAVTVVDRDRTNLTATPAATVDPGTGPRLHQVVGQPESLPFRSRRFDAVTAADTLQRFAPGLALPEIARVLRPDGWLSVVHTTRDDTVPWVRRLAARVQQVDPEAMRGDYGQDAVEAIRESGCFTDLERRDFRNWIPITRDGLLEMVARRPAVQRLPEDESVALLQDVSALFDSLARHPEPLLLPFQSSCWRARPAPCDEPDLDDALSLSL